MSMLTTISPEDWIYQIKFSRLIPTISEQIINRRIITSAAEKAGLKINQVELQNASDLFRKQNQLIDTSATLAWLEKYHLSIEDLEAIMLQQLQTRKLAEYLFINQVESYFVAKQLNYLTAVLYEVILEEKDLALELFYALQEGEITFPQVAHQYIRSIEQRRVGGYLGFCRRLELRPEISAAVFAASPPQVLKPIATSTGIHLILVEEILQPQLTEDLKTQILTELFIDWLNKQRLSY
jgi:parvulin-like peptidyl-prolyl isomerase